MSFISKLPWIPMNLVIKSMDNIEQIKLALTSKKLEACVKRTNIKISYHEIRILDESSSIAINKELDVICCGTSSDSKVNKNELINWLNPNLTVIENTANVLKRLRSIFQFKHCQLILDMEHMKTTSVQEIFSNPEFQKHTGLSISEGEIKSKDLKYIMEVESASTKIDIWNVAIPVSFRSEEAFKFKKIIYEDADWVQIEDLYSLRKSSHVALINNELKPSDFNSLLKHWVNTQYDMFLHLTIVVDEKFILKNVFNGLVVLRTTCYECPMYYVAAKNTEKREQVILSVCHHGYQLVMDARKKEEEYECEGGDEKYTHEQEYDILRLLERKEELKKETENQWQEIKAEVQEIDDKLKTYDVYYDDDGVPTID